jgi:hypothetical protein
MGMEGRCWWLCPSDLTFLWGECTRCFYMTKVHNFRRPRTPFPTIFTRIDQQMKAYFMNKRLEENIPELPSGVIAHWDKSVRSLPLPLPGHAGTVVRHGRLDTAALFDDATAGVLDLKTSSPKEAHLQYYSRQLHTYAIATERPAPGCFKLPTVSRLGLLVFESQRFKHQPHNTSGIAAYFGGGLHWIEVPRDDEAFFSFLDQVLTVLEGPQPTPQAPACVFCNYLDSGRRLGFWETSPPAGEHASGSSGPQ